MDLPPEQPIYKVYESKKRALIPKILSLVGLSIIFYLGVLLNISLLELDAGQETSLKIGSLVVLILLIMLGIVLAQRKAKIPYLFYSNRMTHGKDIIYFTEISNTIAHKDPFDKYFKTYSINLGKNIFLRHIPDEIQLSGYIQQLIEYAKRTTMF